MQAAIAGLRASGLVKRFRGSVALDGLDIEVLPGTMVALTGANGAGKTTTLRVFATLLRPDAGTASVDGADVAANGQEVRRHIGVALVNERSLYWRLSGLENLRFFARVSGVGSQEIEQRCAASLESLALADIAGTAVAGWSAGQRQRLILARATLPDPKALLIDEPMRGLDDEGIGRVRAMLRGHADRGATVLIAGATIGEFSDLCDEVMTLEHGRVAARTRIPAGTRTR